MKKLRCVVTQNTGDSIEIIAPTLCDVTHDGDGVIIIGAGSINIPKDDVPTVLKQAGTLTGDQDMYRDKIEKVNIFLEHQCRKNDKLHYLRHDLCFSKYKTEGLHLNEVGYLKYMTDVKTMIGRIVVAIGKSSRGKSFHLHNCVDENDAYMSILCWNINGMGDELGFSDLHDIIIFHDILGFVEIMKSDTFTPPNSRVPSLPLCSLEKT